MKPIAESLQSIREAVADAEKALIEREQYSETARDQRRASDEMIAYFVERAFVQMLVLLEAHHGARMTCTLFGQSKFGFTLMHLR